MARRRKKGPDVFGIAQGIAALVGLGMVCGIVLPETRAVFTMFVGVALWAVVGLLVIWVGVRWLGRDAAGGVEVENEGGRGLTEGREGHEGYDLRRIDWFQFEKLVALAYGGTGLVTRRGGANPDGGIDLVLERQGELIGIQCKHWRSREVGVKVVREMIGAMTVEGLKKGIIVSLKGCTAEARQLAERHEVELVEESGLVELLKYLDAAEVQRILADRRKVCPKCEREMTLRTARKGANEGAQFWGCSGFPACRQTMPFEPVS